MKSKNCNNCGAQFHRKAREGKKRFSERKFCTNSCAKRSRKGEIRPSIKGNKNPHWKGGKAKHLKGYILVYMPTHPRCQSHGYILEHRLVMEKNLGRFLDKKEVVHHKNGIKNDNRIENLELLKDQSEHIRNHHFDINNVAMLQNGSKRKTLTC